MKVFKQNLVDYERPETTIEDRNGFRFYNRDGVSYPSVTSVLSVDAEKKRSLQEWRNRVGDAEADKISRVSSERGHTAHEVIEHYVQNIPYEGKVMPDALDIIKQFKEVADANINNIRAVELPLWSGYLRAAGTVDLVADFNTTISIIDWKNSLKYKRKEWITDYFMQKAAYAVMFEECTGVPVEQLVTVIGVQSGTPQVFINSRDKWIHSFIQRRLEFDQVVLGES